MTDDVAGTATPARPLIERASKRGLDIVVSSVALVVLSPVLACAALAISCTSPGTPLFSQARVGRHGRNFVMHKLRTMVKDAHLHHQPLLQKKRSDARVLPVGRLLRRTSVDELPNLLNVLRGEMSIVGPRPMLENELRYCEERHGPRIVAERLTVKPGITGLWQISGRAELHLDERIKLDVDYAKTWSFLGDVAIILKTVPALLRSRGAF